ncbi:hypothetical protein Rhe02_22400 [Rhizocola hellebori]|uniref:Protein kinase domain-containing protein n=1 Tax=Rhizocola hellebori TaxID=1392758 RepID=A0A8J3Q550_9ACTN|nr:hypothetical protein Rhe02_22400 [Rhizocola hellebori]
MEQVNAARSAQDLFGGTDAGHRYRTMAKLLHPDTAPAGQLRLAREAFARLALLWEQYRRGERKLYEGDIAHLYSADGGAALRKMPRRARDNDLMQREAQALSALERHGEDRHRAYAPLLLNSFRQRDPDTGVQRVVNVLQHLPGFVSLALVARCYPQGVPARDAAWMWRRLLVALGYAHRAGVVHGAVVPEHVLIHPGEHGLALVDWCYSTRGDEPIPAMVGGRLDLYPPEVAQRRVAGPGTDIYLAAKCMSWLMGAHTPGALRRFVKGCTIPYAKARPQDAWRLLAELDDLLHQLYGKRTFRPFTL